MPNLKSVQMLLLDDVFRMGGGYVLNFSDKTFGNFFREEVGIDIDHPRYSVEGGSKAKRFRYFVQNESLPAVVKAIKALWDYRQALMERDGEQETLANIDSRMEALISSIGGQWDKPTPAAPPASAIVLDPTKVAGFTKRLLDLGSLAPHPRGYAFEEFLRDLFDAYRLEAHKAFRNRGEQIDGSFQLDGHTYLLEAKWQNAPIGCGRSPRVSGQDRGEIRLVAWSLCQLCGLLGRWSGRLWPCQADHLHGRFRHA